MKRPPKETFHVRFPPDMLEQIRETADAHQLLPSELVREAVKEYLARLPKAR